MQNCETTNTYPRCVTDEMRLIESSRGSARSEDDRTAPQRPYGATALSVAAHACTLFRTMVGAGRGFRDLGYAAFGRCIIPVAVPRAAIDKPH